MPKPAEVDPNSKVMHDEDYAKACLPVLIRDITPIEKEKEKEDEAQKKKVVLDN